MKRSILILLIASTLPNSVLAQELDAPRVLVDLPPVPQNHQLWSDRQKSLVEKKETVHQG